MEKTLILEKEKRLLRHFFLKKEKIINMGKTLLKTQEFERVGYPLKFPVIIVFVIIGASFVKEELEIKGEAEPVLWRSL